MPYGVICELVQLQVADLLEFGPELPAAKLLIDECLAQWSADSGAELRALLATLLERWRPPWSALPDGWRVEEDASGSDSAADDGSHDEGAAHAARRRRRQSEVGERRRDGAGAVEAAVVIGAASEAERVTGAAWQERRGGCSLARTTGASDPQRLA